MDRFTLLEGRWYAAEILGEEFGSELRSYSPIRVEAIKPQGGRKFELTFYHATYPEGVREKVYALETLERNQNFVLARSGSHRPIRWIIIHAITPDWLGKHFGADVRAEADVERWLELNA